MTQEDIKKRALKSIKEALYNDCGNLEITNGEFVDGDLIPFYEALSQALDTAFREWKLLMDKEIIGPDIRHITDTKAIEDAVEENEGNVTYDEVISGVQKEIDAQNTLRAQQRLKLQELGE